MVKAIKNSDPTMQVLGRDLKFQLRDGLARIIGIPVIALIMHMEYNHWTSSGWKGYLISLSYTIAYWEGIRHLWAYLQRRYSHYSQTGQRIFFLTISVLLYGVVVTVCLENFSSILLDLSCGWEKIFRGYTKGLIPTTLVLMVYEMVYFFHSWKEKVIESEAINRTMLESQLNALKNQLDPHFLFNSLNVLSSLIDENPPAQEYLSRLSDVYRYVLMSKDKNTVSLREEMEFVEAFVYLAKVRFQAGLEVHTRIPESSLGQTVAPLSVQLLVENALKHNVISREHPLHIDIRVVDGYLWVSNAIHKKVHLENTSTRVGLQNILERYKLLSELPVKVNRDALTFEVALPLLQA